jgi:hypothetical protein
MSVTSIHVMSLLTSEVLGLIVSHINGPSLRRLWGCGDQLLNSKLSSPSGLHAFNFSRQHDRGQSRTLHMAFKWLQIFRGLRILQFVFSGSTMVPNLNVTQLSLLPQTLYEIQFVFYDCEQCWMRDSEQDKEFNFPWHKRVHFDFRAYFPSLTRLELECNLFMSPYTLMGVTRVGLQDSDFDLLPPSLTHLNLHANDSITPFGLKNLPKNLTSLALAWKSFDQAIFTELRALPFLQDLRLPHLDDFTDQDMCHLPTGLLRLQLGQSQSFNGSGFVLLPRSLRKFDAQIMNCDCTYLKDLPVSLEKLHITSARIEVEHLPLFPPHLRSLSFTDWKNTINDYDMSLFPRHLTSLAIIGNRNMTNECFPQLPPNLTRFTVTNEQWIRIAPFKPSEPRTLRMIHLSNDCWIRYDGYWISHKLALETGNLDALSSFRSAGILLCDNIASSDGWMPIHIAAREGHLHILKWMTVGDDPFCGLHTKISSSQWNIAHVAAWRGHLDILEWAHSQGVDLCCETRHGESLMFLAVDSGKVEVLKWLKKMGIRCTGTMMDGTNIIQRAKESQQDNHELLEWLELELTENKNTYT